ncbi:disintegrin and metalloproteinase domain-containing protein 21-like [Phascolarctos cinereus]|uniref:Disintegrin and metalloproteinase domain-containing protein 21-like n=1 Tax=Phascolarctos cinereus TaxID=38626 RepID=A0A6P5K970_PHACI|nr:disintegrin and metalloproteinase domain-containing protein 21-like [Phascolarctos cinereus]
MGAAVTGAAPFLSGPLLLLGLSALLTLSTCRDMSLQRPPVSSELVIPEEISPPTWASKVSGQLAYSLHITGKKHIVHLLPKKMLLPRHLPVFTYVAKDAPQEEDPFFRNDCYYYGYMEGIPKSLAALSTCSGGLWGTLQVNGRHYQIQPVPASSTFEHHLYPTGNTGASNLTRALARKEIDEDFFQGQEATASPRTATFNDVRLRRQKVEMGVVVGKLWYESQNSNKTVLLQDMLFTLNLVDTLFMQIKAHASLSSLEFWTNPSPMTIIKKLNSVLQNSAEPQSRSPGEQQLCDLVHLFQQHSSYPVFGIDFRTAKCNPYPSLAVRANLGVHLIFFSVLVSCEMGHDLGKFSDEENLQGQRKPFPMGSRAQTSDSFKSSCTFDGPLASVGSGANRFSGTSEEKMEKQKCGNKVVEEGKECGSETECRKNPCCQQGCTLSKGTKCSTGLCCKDCKILPAGRVCRLQANECDLPEFCNGTSGFCPDDAYKQDGTPCSGKGYCYKKKCGSHLQQCQALFGQQAENAPPQCYKEVNSRGDRFGNCGPGQISFFKACDTQNIFCGRLQCVNIEIIPHIPHYYTLIQTYLKEPAEKEGLLCWGTAFNKTAKAKGVIDLGAVEDGSSCGENRMCVNKTCLNISSIHQECVPEQCNYRGVCNNRGNCHCNFGWGPPFCRDPGYGGSSDSGPTVNLGSETNTSFLSWRTYLIHCSICSSFVVLNWAVTMLYKKRERKRP